MKKKLKYVFLLGALCMAACATEPEVPVNNPTAMPTQEAVAPEVTKEPEATTIPEATKAPELTDVPKEETIPVRILLESKKIDVWEDGRQLYAVIWQNPLIGGEDASKYPAISTVFRSLKTLQDRESESVAANLAGVAEDLKQYAHEMDVACYDSTRYFVQRADNHIISMRCNLSTDTGGIHPMSFVSGYNFSTETGALLSLSDVVTDPEQVRALVKKSLSEKYADCLFDEWESLFAEMETDALSWTLDYEGLTFYFSPYELSFYAAGVLTVDIDFAMEPALFKKAYMAVPEQGSAMALPFHSYVEIEGTNGTKDTVLVGQCREEDDEFSFKLEIEKNGKSILEYPVYAYEYKAYLVAVEEKDFLFVDAIMDNDYKILYVFDLSQDRITAPVSEMNAGFVTMPTDAETYSYAEEVFNNPAEIRLSSRVDVFGTMEGTRSYSFDAKSGTLVPQTDVYTLDETMFPLISKIPLEVTLVGDNTKATVPAGTEFIFLRTDGNTYAEFRLPDGRECRVTREGGWPYTVNGVPEEECFDGIGYAG